jgi:hypothetical protein
MTNNTSEEITEILVLLRSSTAADLGEAMLRIEALERQCTSRGNLGGADAMIAWRNEHAARYAAACEFILEFGDVATAEGA